jgi:DNA-binding XRE family transcriptional regulator
MVDSFLVFLIWFKIQTNINKILLYSVLYLRVPQNRLNNEIWSMKDSTPKDNIEELRLIAMRLKELRKAKGYSNYEHIAFALEMSRSAYWRLETGANFELKTLIKICKVLDVSLEEFFKGIDLPNSKIK